MPRLPSVSSKKFCSFLESQGCTLARIEGDHYVYVKEGISRPLVVPIRKQLPVFIIFNNLRTLGISRTEFIRALKKV